MIWPCVHVVRTLRYFVHIYNQNDIDWIFQYQTKRGRLEVHQIKRLVFRRRNVEFTVNKLITNTRIKISYLRQTRVSFTKDSAVTE